MVRIRYRRFQKSWTLRLGVDNARILWYNRLLWQESKSGFGIFCAHFGISAWTFGYWYRNDANYPDSWNSFQGAHGEQLALLVGVVLSLKFHRLGLRFSIFVFFFFAISVIFGGLILWWFLFLLYFPDWLILDSILILLNNKNLLLLIILRTLAI